MKTKSTVETLQEIAGALFSYHKGGTLSANDAWLFAKELLLISVSEKELLDAAKKSYELAVNFGIEGINTAQLREAIDKAGARP